MTDLEQQKKDEINEYEIRLWKELFSETNKDLGEKSLDLLQTKNELIEMTECRDTLQVVIAELNKELSEAKFNLIDVSFGSRLVLDVVRMERDKLKDILTMIAKHGTANPTWAVKLAKAAVE